MTTETLRLIDVSQPQEVQMVLRNLLGTGATVNLVSGEQTVAVSGSPEQQQLARKIVDDVNGVERPSQDARASEALFTGAQMTVHTGEEARVEQTFYLPATMQAADEGKLVATLRQAVSPTTKVYLLETRHAVVMNTTADQLQVAQTKISQLVPAWSADQAHATSAVFEEQKTDTYTAKVVEQAFYLAPATDRLSGNEVLVALRNTMSPYAKIYMVPSKNTIVILATADEMQLAKKVFADLEPQPRA